MRKQKLRMFLLFKQNSVAFFYRIILYTVLWLFIDPFSFQFEYVFCDKSVSTIPFFFCKLEKEVQV